MSLPVGVIRFELDDEPVVASGQRIENTLNRIETKSESVGKKMEISTKLVATSLIGLGTSAFSVYQGFDQLEKVQLRAEKSALAVARAQKQVNDLEREGKTNTEAYSIATERLRLAQEQASQAAQDVSQQTVQLGLSLGTTGLTMVTTIISLRNMATAHVVAGSAATGQAVANVGLTASFRALTAAMMSNPLGIALVAGSIAALAAYETNLFGLKDRVDGLVSSFTIGKPEISSFHNEFDSGKTTIQGYTSSLRDLNSEYESTINILKKNDVTTELGKVQEEMASSMLMMGSLEQMYVTLRSAGVEGFVREFQKDLRNVKSDLASLGIVVDFRDALHDRNFTARGVLGNQVKTLSFVSAIVSNYFRDIKADALQGLTGLSFTSALHGNLGFLGGITQEAALTLINQPSNRYKATNPHGAIGARAQNLGGISASQGAKGKSSKHGGNKGPSEYLRELTAYGGLRSSADKGSAGSALAAAQGRMQSLFEFLTLEGVGIPAFEIWGPAGYQRGKVTNPNFDKQLADAIAEATRRRNERLSPYRGLGYSDSDLMNMMNDSQGMSDLAGMRLFKQLASLG